MTYEAIQTKHNQENQSNVKNGECTLRQNVTKRKREENHI